MSGPSFIGGGTMAEVFNFTIEQGTTWQAAWPITDGAGVAVDLTGYTVKAQVRENEYSTVKQFEWSTALGNISVAGSQVTLSVTPADSLDWDWDHGVYDVVMTSPSGVTSRIAQGKLTVDRAVTR